MSYSCLGVIAVIALGYFFIWFLRKFQISDFQSRYVFITGCDTGFGNLLAKRLDKMGFHVFAACLGEEGTKELKESCSERLQALVLNVTNSDHILKAVEQVKNCLPPGKGLWALVNNAGVSGPVSSSELLTVEDDYLPCLNINLFGMISVTKAFLPMLRKNKGRIVNVSSAFGRLSFPGAVPYSISKYGVEAYSDGLRRELYKTGVTVHILEPGLFTTNITSFPQLSESLHQCLEKADEEYLDYYGININENLKSIKKLTDSTSSDLYKVIDAHVHAVSSRFPKARYRVGWDANTIFWFLTIAPEWISDALIGIKFSVSPRAQRV